MAQSSPFGSDVPRVCPRTGKVIGASRWLFLFYIVSGVSAVVWFLVRVVPKPSRATYPCQRVAMPLASSFVLWVAGLTGTLFAFRSARRNLYRARYALATLCAAAGIAVAFWALSLPGEPAGAEWVPGDPPNTPMGVAQGIHPGRVVWVHDPAATNWDGSSNYWWSSVNTDQVLVDDMLVKSIRYLTGETSETAAWDALFRHFNQTHDRGDSGYTGGEGIAIKINQNVAGNYSATNEPFATPQLIHALLWQLVNRAGVSESAITVYDASRCICDPIIDYCHPAFPGVTFVDKNGQGECDAAIRHDDVPVHYTDTRVGSSGTSRFPRCVVNASYLINMALLRGHSMAGITLCAKNHFGSIWRPGGGFSPSNVHPSIQKSNAASSTNSLVDLMGHEHLGGKTVLYMIDALHAAVNQSSSRPSRWRSSPFNNDWTSSLFVSQDGVAIDSVGLDFCRTEPALGNTVGGSADKYLHEAALAHNPPSGAFYDPEGDGTRLASLGVHEHWNNAIDKQYSRNLGTGDGIELFTGQGMGGYQRGDSNADGNVDVSDAVAILVYLFGGQGQLSCVASADANDTGTVDVADAIYLLGYLFAQGDAIPAPFGSCGEDPTADDLTCESYLPCSGPPPTTAVDLIAPTDPARVLIPADGSLGLSWTAPDFNDAAWISGEAAVGYDEDDTYRSHFTTDVGPPMNGVNTAAYIRIPFTLDAPLAIERLTLRVKYDDGCIAYINGTKVAERNAPPDPAWDSTATDSHRDSDAVVFEGLDATAAAGIITVGENVLAIHGLNSSLGSSDFLIAVEMAARTTVRR